MTPGSPVYFPANVKAIPVQSQQASEPPTQLLTTGTRATYLGDVKAPEGGLLARILISTTTGPVEYFVPPGAITAVPPPSPPQETRGFLRRIRDKVTGSEPDVHRVLYSRFIPWVIALLMLIELALCIRLLIVRPYLEFHYHPGTEYAHLITAVDAVNTDTLQRLREAEELVRIAWPQRDEFPRTLEPTVLARVLSAVDLARQINATQADSPESRTRLALRKVPPDESGDLQDLATHLRAERPWHLAELAFARAVVAQRGRAVAPPQTTSPDHQTDSGSGSTPASGSGPARSSTESASPTGTEVQPSITPGTTGSDASDQSRAIDKPQADSSSGLESGSPQTPPKPPGQPGADRKPDGRFISPCPDETKPAMGLLQLVFEGRTDEVRHPRHDLECRMDMLLQPLTPSERAEARRLAKSYAAGDASGFLDKSDFNVFYIACCLGAIGALIQGIMSIAVYTGNRKFMPSWSLFYLLRPVAGAGIACGFCLIIKGGFLDMGDAKEGGQVSYFTFAAVSLLVGMFVGEAMEKLKLVAAAFLHSNEQRDALGDRAPIVEQATVTADPLGRARARLVLTGTDFHPNSTVFLNGISSEVAHTTFAADTLTVDLHEPLVADRKLTIVILNPPPQPGVSRPFVLKT